MIRSLTVVTLLGGLAACDDDGRFDQDRYQEQDHGATGTSDDTSSGPTDPESADGSATPTVSTEPVSTEPVSTEPVTDTVSTDPVSTDTVSTDPELPGEADQEAAPALPASEVLDDDEVAGLLWMREEEQLAHDVYVALGERWGLRVFENIAASEQTHIEATIDLLDRYELADPAVGNEPGTFTDPAIQELYDELVARGLESRADALTVGATIEELDIADLRQRAEATDEAAIDDVYARLERASRNHLRAFVGQLELLGVEYEPTVLDDFEEIVSAPMERGRDDH